MPLAKSHLRSFWPIHGTPYVFCDIRKTLGASSRYVQTRFTNLIIDIRQGKCLMRVEWQNLNPTNSAEGAASRSTEYKGIILDRDCMSLIYEQVFRFDSSRFRRENQKSAGAASSYRKKKDIWRIGLSGDAQKLNDPPEHFIHNQSSYRCLNFSSLVAVSSNRLMQYQLQGNELQQSDGWDEIGDSLMQLCSLPNQGYLFSNTRKGTVVFLQPKEPKVRSFPVRSIFAHLPAPPSGVTPWAQLASLSWQLVPLSACGESSLLAYFQMPGFPIFEIHLDQLRDGKEKDVFNFLGFSPTCRPFVSMRQNQAILFTNTLVRRGAELCTGVPIYSLEKGPNGWPTEYGFVFQPQSISLPASIQRICEIPIDDEYLLGYGRDTFWGIRMDGSAVKPIFPRTGPFRRRR
jgi:hypothetical protein